VKDLVLPTSTCSTAAEATAAKAPPADTEVGEGVRLALKNLLK